MSRFLFHIASWFSIPILLVFLTPVVLSAEVKGVVSEIAISPPDAVSLKELRSIVDIREGDPVSRKALKKGVELLFLKGRFDDIKVDARETDGKVRLSFNFKLKERVGKIYFSGNKDVGSRRLRDILTISEGDGLDLDLLERQVHEVKDLYLKKGYFQCEVEFKLIRTPDRREVDVEYVIREGGRASVSGILVAGNNAFTAEELLRKVPIKAGEPYDEYRVLRGVKRMEGFYKRRGYTEARAGFQARYIPEGNGVDVVFNIEEGGGKGEEKEVRVEEIVFKGNLSISSRVLRRQMLTRKVFSEDTFSKDMEAVEFIYKKKGFLSARVTDKEFAYSEDGRSVRIDITVSEGPRTIIRGIEVEGNYLYGEEYLVRESGMEVGEPPDPWSLDEGMTRLLSLYSRSGYIYAKVSRTEEFTEDRSGVVLRVRVDEGIPVKIGKIIIRGNDITRADVIMRELLVKPGDVYDPERVFKSQQRVYRLGFLSNVRLSPIDEDVVEERKNLLLSVKERRAGALEIGAGYGTEEGLRGFAELSHRNLYGTGASARLRGDVSQLESSYLLSFNKPWLLGHPVDGRFSLIDQVTRRKSYSLEKYAAVAGVDKDLTEFVKGSLQYEYEISRAFDVEEGAIIDPKDKGTIRIGTVSPIIIRDSRDNPFNPRTGSVNSLKLDYSAGTATGSEAEFARYMVQSSWYAPLFKKVVGAFSVRGGWAEHFGETREIPISKRFFLGGRTSVRGFELDSIGPKGADGSPIGGDAYLNLNAEMRFPIYKRVGGLIFFDAGNVWLRAIEDVDVFDLRSSAGLGLRYMTPIGPLSLDAGWKLDREKGESAWEWHFTIGNVF